VPNVLTTQSTVSCGHKPGNVLVTSTAKLRVAHAPVLVEPGIRDQLLPPPGPPLGCSTPVVATPVSAPCKKVVSVAPTSLATKLKSNGSLVVLDTLTGTTDGTVSGTTPQPLLNATANQSKLVTL